MMALARSCAGFVTHQWMLPVRECWSWARVQCWQNLTCPVFFGRSQSIPMTVTCWVCGGGATLMWIKCCLWPPVGPQAVQCGGRRLIMDSGDP